MSNNQRVSKQVFGMKLGGWCFNHRGIPRCCHRRRPRFLSFGHRSMLCFPWFFWVNDWSWAMMNHNDYATHWFPWTSLNIPWLIESGSLILVHRSRLGTWGEAHREALGGIAKLAVDQHCVRRRVVWLACSETSISTYDICASVYISTHTHTHTHGRFHMQRICCTS